MDKAIANYENEPIKPDLKKPDNGKAWRRKKDGLIYTSEVILGYITFVDGKFLKTPIKEVPEDYELVDIE